jgi:hypothetical protein
MSGKEGFAKYLTIEDETHGFPTSLIKLTAQLFAEESIEEMYTNMVVGLMSEPDTLTKVGLDTSGMMMHLFLRGIERKFGAQPVYVNLAYNSLSLWSFEVILPSNSIKRGMSLPENLSGRRILSQDKNASIAIVVTYMKLLGTEVL